MSKILLIDDSLETQKTVSMLMSAETLVVASTLKEAELELKKAKFDLVLLDLSLPDGDGLEFLLKIKQEYAENQSVILLTANDEVSRKVLGFSLGVDDYITKPFNPAEFKARVQAKLERSRITAQASSEFVVDSLRFHIPSKRLFYSDKKQELAITVSSLEFRLLLFLAQNQDQIFSRDQLLDKVWGDASEITDRTVDTHVSALRGKIKKYGFTIESVYGEGYRFLSSKNTKRKAA